MISDSNVPRRNNNNKNENKKFVPITKYGKGKSHEKISISQFDPVIFFTVIILALFGILMIFSSSYYKAHSDGNMFLFMSKQMISVAIGFTGMIAASMFNYNKWLKKPIPLFYILSNILLVFVKFFGETINGAKRWIRIPVIGFSFQPSEFAKVMVILMIALYLSNDPKRTKSLKGFVVCGLIAALPCALVFWGKNLSTALIIMAIAFGMLFIASPYVLPYLGLGAAGVAGLVFMLTKSGGFRGARLEAWKNPFQDPLDKGFQTIQSLYAVASGGLFGLGLGQSNQKLKFMPEPQNDFIFAIICEELGFFGAAVVLALFAILIWRCVKVALNAPDLFATLIVAGTIILIGVQVIINVAVVTNTIPNTGIPMPFISYGGTSVIFIMGMMGIVLNISRYSRT